MRLQSAIEYLTTYGWVLLVMAIAISILFLTGGFNPNTYAGQQCAISSGFSCVGMVLNSSGVLAINLQQSLSDPINITAIGCNQKGIPTNMVPIPPANQAYLTIGSSRTFSVQCYQSSGSSAVPLGSSYAGYVIVNYTDQATMVPGTAIGRVVARASTSGIVSTTSTSTTSSTSTSSTSTTTTSTTATSTSSTSSTSTSSTSTSTSTSTTTIYVAQFNGQTSNILTGTLFSSSTAATLSVWFRVIGNGNKAPRGIMLSPAEIYLDICVSSQALFYVYPIMSVYGGTCPAVGTWTHYVGTYGGGAGVLYINGVPAGTNTGSGAFSSGPAYIGQYTEGSYNFNGVLADVQVYGNALTAGQVYTLYSEGMTGAPIAGANLIGWWPLNGNAVDMSGNGHNGIATAVTYTSP